MTPKVELQKTTRVTRETQHEMIVKKADLLALVGAPLNASAEVHWNYENIDLDWLDTGIVVRWTTREEVTES